MTTCARSCSHCISRACCLNDMAAIRCSSSVYASAADVGGVLDVIPEMEGTCNVGGS